MNGDNDLLKKAHVALEHCNGNISQAASLIGVSTKVLRNAINTYPELSSYLKTPKPITKEEAICKPALVKSNKEEIALVAAVKKEDRKVRDGLMAIGVDSDAASEAMAFSDFGRFHFNDVRHMIGGGMAKLALDLIADIKKVRDEIDETRRPGGGLGDDSDLGSLEYEQMLREDRRGLIKLLLEVSRDAQENAKTTMLIEAEKAKIREAKAGKSGAPRPAFAPLAMQVNGDVTVNPVAENKDQTS